MFCLEIVITKFITIITNQNSNSNRLFILKLLHMQTMTIGGNYKLKLTSKKLRSGKCQVKFYASLERKKNLYGYVLADVGETLNDVIGKITSRLDQVKRRDSFHHINLYSIGKRSTDDANFLVFDA